MKPITIAAAKHISKAFDVPIVIVFGLDPVTGVQHVTTYGDTVANCEAAARGGNILKEHLGWDPKLCKAVPARARRKAKATDDQSLEKKGGINPPQTASKPEAVPAPSQPQKYKIWLDEHLPMESADGHPVVFRVDGGWYGEPWSKQLDQTSPRDARTQDESKAYEMTRFAAMNAIMDFKARGYSCRAVPPITETF